MDEPGKVSRAAPRQVDREAQRVLPLLARPGAVACLLPAKRYGGAERVAIRLAGSRSHCARVDLSIIQALAARDLLARDGNDRWKISNSGAAWLQRCRSPEDSFRAQHQVVGHRTIEAPDHAHRTVRANRAESPLEWLRGRRDPAGGNFLSEQQFEAGERLRRDFTAAAIAPSVTANWSGLHLPREKRRGRGGSSELSESALAARRRFEAALAEIGPEMAGLLIDVCCLLMGLEAAERARKWPKRSAKVVLRVALGRLADHYGLRAAATCDRRRRRHRWAQPGYRPMIDGGNPDGGNEGAKAGFDPARDSN